MALPNPEIEGTDLIRESREPINENFAHLDNYKAEDAEVVHNTGDEDIDGEKNFLQSPQVPTPTSANDAVNKDYIDNEYVKIFSIRSFA